MALVDWILKRTPNFRTYGRWDMREGGARWGFPVLASAKTLEAVVDARSAWERSAAQAIEARLNMKEVDVRSTRTLPPPGVRVVSMPADYLEPECVVSEQLALYSGRRWDAQARLAL